MKFISELKQRNQLLFWFGLFNIVVGLLCFLLMQFDEQQILTANRWLKPMKFYFSVGLMIFTMGWLLYYLNNTKKIRKYSWLLIITMFFENALILLQAIRGTTSHYNESTLVDGTIFNLMALFILIFTITFVFICVSFFRQKEFFISESYLWGIRLGLLFFIFFSLEGGMMIGLAQHTVGGSDGGPGLPLTNWSTKYGDLRIAHFFGLHSLQVLPLVGYYIAKSKNQIIVLSIIYFVIVMAVFIQALAGMPLIK